MLQVDYTGGYNTFSLARFGQKFVDQVANPRNILLWHQHRQPTTLSELHVLCYRHMKLKLVIIQLLISEFYVTNFCMLHKYVFHQGLSLKFMLAGGNYHHNIIRLLTQ